MNRIAGPLVLSLILISVLAGGCTTGSPGTVTTGPGGDLHQSPPEVYPTSNPPSVYITYPDFDGGVEAGNVTVTVLVRNFSVVNRTGGQNVPGEGHLVCFKDVIPPTTPGLTVKTEPGTFQVSSQTWCTWHNVSQGTHTFTVELVNNDNTPLIPPVLDAVDVTAVS